MKHPKIALTFLCLWLLIIFSWYRAGNANKTKNDKLLKNNIEFSGTIKSYKISWNHCFAIILIDSVKSNTTFFNPKVGKQYFPYAIKNGMAEVYTTVCETTSKKIGHKMSLNSNQRKLTFEMDQKPFETEIYIISSNPDVAFIKENSIFKISK